MSTKFGPCLSGFLIAALFPATAPAAVHTVPAGETLTLKEDLVLTGDDVLEVQGTAAKRCTVVGNGHALRTAGKWTGRVRLLHCDCRGLGTAARPGLDLAA